VLVGPSTAVTPAPGARPFAKLDGDDEDNDEKAMIPWVSASLGFERCFTMRRIKRRGLSFGTSPERIAPESLTRLHSGFVHRNISR
jgi:hypothetical protein